MRAAPCLTLTPLPDAVGAKVGYPESVEKEAVTLARAALDHLDGLYRVARNLTGRDSDAEDLVQETYTRAIAAAGQFTAGTNLRAWLFRILRNAHIDAHRRARTNLVDGGFEDEFAADATTSASEPLRGDAELERLRGVVTTDIEKWRMTRSEVIAPRTP
jgi:RNA polymerase sigma-70 factor, ECF subfamily